MKEHDLLAVLEVIKQSGTTPDWIMFENPEDFERLVAHMDSKENQGPVIAPSSVEPTPNRSVRRMLEAEARRASNREAKQIITAKFRCGGCEYVLDYKGPKIGANDGFRCPECGLISRAVTALSYHHAMQAKKEAEVTE